MGTTQALLVATGEKRDGRGHRLATLERRAALVAKYRPSGLSMAAFARREGLAYSTFAGWVLKSARCERRSGPLAPVRFTEVRLPGPVATAAALEVRLIDGTLVRGSSAGELAVLVRALRA